MAEIVLSPRAGGGTTRTAAGWQGGLGGERSLPRRLDSGLRRNDGVKAGGWRVEGAGMPAEGAGMRAAGWSGGVSFLRWLGRRAVSARGVDSGASRDDGRLMGWDDGGGRRNGDRS